MSTEALEVGQSDDCSGVLRF